MKGDGDADLAVLAIEKLPHRLSPSLVRFSQALALIGVHALLGPRARRLFNAALRATIRKPGLVRLQLELFFTHRADLNRKRHNNSSLPDHGVIVSGAFKGSEATESPTEIVNAEEPIAHFF